ncbi:Multidrug resistance-associated protein 7 [Oopsacas minuta]|uniref:Multidrug resistance-associated protein 7 n=1 Tax=Oopsacas minuta TaxID=111878 RepID=A0AAV7JTP9_9METZ|nr:Multidrug resistance-associated protein 7 [Oopsacas minuta]
MILANLLFSYSLSLSLFLFLQVFTSVSLFAILIGPLNGFPLVLQWIAEAWVSLGRLNKFLSVQELNEERYYSMQQPDDPSIVLAVQRGKFSWDSNKKNKKIRETIERPTLKCINVVIHSGQFVGIVGQVGSGKSSIFSALTMELNKREGSIYYKHLREGFGIVSQESWIQHGTIRSNILFGMEYNADLYERVVSACALLPDFALAYNSDLTEVGENGVNLSGGQKARINLARACYQQKPCLLLDDPLSAVDANVAQHILANCLHKLLSRKTRILITHRVELLKSVDVVFVINEGKVVTAGSPDKILPSVESSFEVERMKGVVKTDEITEVVANDINGDGAVLVKEEEKCTGPVKPKIYWSYWRSIGHVFAFLILLTMLIMESSKRITDVWLSIWTTANITQNHTNNNISIVQVKISDIRHVRISTGRQV